MSSEGFFILIKVSAQQSCCYELMLNPPTGHHENIINTYHLETEILMVLFLLFMKCIKEIDVYIIKTITLTYLSQNTIFKDI